MYSLHFSFDYGLADNFTQLSLDDSSSSLDFMMTKKPDNNNEGQLQRANSNETLVNNSYDEGEEDDYDDDDEFDYNDEEEEDDFSTCNSAQVDKTKPDYIEDEEDLAFQANFDRLTSSYISPNLINVKTPASLPQQQTLSQTNTSLKQNSNVILSIGSGSRGAIKVQSQAPQVNNLPSLDFVRTKMALDEVKQANNSNSTRRFGLLTKKSKKSQIVPIDVPKNVEFVVKYEKNTKSERDEKDAIKKRVLRLHQAQQEEDVHSSNNILPYYNQGKG